MSRLWLVSTPIGNLKDITIRAKEVLAKVNVIACEDTRKTGLLLNKCQIASKAKLLSYYEQNELSRIPQIISLLNDGKEVALVTNAGTPTLSDPGYKLVREAIIRGIPVIPVPGASSILAGLVASGLPTDRFIFLGFLPKKPGKRHKLFASLPHEITVILFESPYRLLKTLKEIKNTCGEIDLVVCAELTKFYEQIKGEKVSSLISYFEKNKPRGEYTLLLRLG